MLMRTDIDGAVVVDATPARMTMQTFRGRRSGPIRIVPRAAAARP
jgi:hypothetical protein